MIAGLRHRHALGILCGVLLLSAAPTARAASAARAQADPSHYPAGATRAAFHPRVSEFARASASKSKKKKSKKAKLRGNPARALAAFEAMQAHYYLLGSGLYAGEPFSYLWPFSQALAVTVSLANIPHLGVSMARELKAREVGLRSYLDANNSGAEEGVFTSTLAAFDGTVAPPAGPGGTKYYDDNDWVGIELVRLYKLTHEPSVRESAEAIMAFETAAWQTNPELGCPGGIPFDNAATNTDRNTVTTAPAAELALQLYGLTHNAEYLRFAEMAYQWVRTCLLAPGELYADHVNPKGVVEGSLWSYNQGTMIGAGAMLYQATGNAGFLYQARQTARAAVAYFTPERLAGENPFFPSVFFRNLMYLDSITHDPPGKAPAQNYVNYAWQYRRLTDDVFVAGTPPSAQLLYQAAVAQIYALLSSPASTYF